MASQFNELSALSDMQGAGKGHTTAGRVAAFGRQFAGRGGKKKGDRVDEVIRLENQAKMAAFNSQLRREELANAHGYSLEKMREAATHTEASDVRGHGHKIAQIQTEHNAKADAEMRLHGYKMESAKEYNQDLIGQAGGIHNRGFEANPSTGAVKFSLPIKTQNASTNVNDTPIDLSEYDK